MWGWPGKGFRCRRQLPLCAWCVVSFLAVQGLVILAYVTLTQPGKIIKTDRLELGGRTSATRDLASESSYDIHVTSTRDVTSVDNSLYGNFGKVLTGDNHRDNTAGSQASDGHGHVVHDVVFQRNNYSVILLSSTNVSLTAPPRPINRTAFPGTYNGVSKSVLRRARSTYAFSSNIGNWMDLDFHIPDKFPLGNEAQNAAAFVRSYGRGPRSVTCLLEGTETVRPADNESSSCRPAKEPFLMQDRGNTSGVLSSFCRCICKPGWSGVQCNVPDIVLYSDAQRFTDRMTLRASSRRVINAISFNVEFELLEARLHELRDLVDVFVIYESNYTLFGDPKPLRLFNRLLKGYLGEFHSRIFYLFCGTYPLDRREEGWVPEQYARTYIGQEGMKHVTGTKPDDLFLYTDADELPSRDALLFLKLNDGYPEPFGVSLRWSVYGFFWHQYDNTRIMVGATCGMFRYVYGHDVQKLRSADYLGSMSSSALRGYLSTGASVYQWTLAMDYLSAGWHCSWCLTPEKIRLKLTSAINADFPRWGNYPEKLKLTYIRGLIRKGYWFDDYSTVGQKVNETTDAFFAPPFMLQHQDIYGHLTNINQVR